jgi:hypothetical protein
LYLLNIPLLFAAVLLLPAAPSKAEERRILALDMAIALTASLVLWWYFVFAPHIASRSFAPETLLAVLYPLFAAVILIVLIMLWERSSHSPAGRPLALLALGSAARLAQGVRSIDITARFGGDEFCVLLPETSAGAARVAAARLDRSIREEQVADRLLSASIGVGGHRAGWTAGQVLEEADKDLYRLKADRRGT